MTDCFPTVMASKSNWNSLNYWQLQIAIVILATGLFSAASYPTLEGWGLWLAYEEYGFNFYVNSLPSQCDRPLHLLPSLIAWLSPGRYDIGCMILGGLLTILRAGLAIAIARSLNISRAAEFLVFLVCMLQPVWPASGYERFHAAQSSFVLFLSALYCCTSSAYPINYRALFAGFFFSLSGFMIYQALFLVALATPIIFFLLTNRSLAKTTSIVFWASCLTYLIFQTVITHYIPGSNASSHKGPFTIGSIARIYVTVWNSGVFVVLSLIAIGIFLLLYSYLNGASIKRQIAVVIILLLSPLCGVIFYNNGSKLNDPDRIMLPVMTSIIVMFFATCHFRRSTQIVPAFNWINLSCCIITIVSFASLMIESLRCLLLQLALLHQLSEHSHQFNDTTCVKLVDNTGKYGDVYTFLPPHITFATRSYGIPGKFEICTPNNVLKKHPYAKRYPIRTTPACEKCASANYSTVLQIDYGKRVFLLGRSIIVHE